MASQTRLQSTIVDAQDMTLQSTVAGAQDMAIQSTMTGAQDMALQSSVTGSGAIDIGVPLVKGRDIAPEKAVPQVAGHRKGRLENIVYGEPVYWLTIIGSFVVVIGGLIAFLTSNNFIDTGYWISAVWDGLPKEEIWVNSGNLEPNGHWYLSHLTTGDGLQIVGLAIALLSINVGLIAAAIVMLKRKETVFAVFAMVSVLIVTLAMFVTIEA